MNGLLSDLDWHPLTLAQLDFWEEFRAHPGVVVSTVAHATRFEGDLDPAALAEAIRIMVAETDVLALRFRDGPDGPRQAVDRSLAPKLRLIDLSAHPTPQTEAQMMMQADLQIPLDLTKGPLSAQWLIRTDDSDWTWYCRGHHIFLDGYAMALIERRVAELYAHLTQGGAAGAPFAGFPQFLAEEDAYRHSLHHTAAGEYWRDQIAQGPSLPVLRKGSEDYPAAPLLAEIGLEDLAEPLRHMGARLDLGAVDLLTLLSGIWLWRHPCRTDQEPRSARAVWLPYMSRLGSVSARIPAMVVNILPFRIEPDPATSLAQNLSSMGRTLRRLRRHGRYRIEQLTRDQGLDSRHRFFFSPLINVMPFDRPEFACCTVDHQVLAAGPGDGFNLSFTSDGRGDGLSLCMEADPKLTPETMFSFHADAFPAFLRRCAMREDDPMLEEIFG